MANEWVLVDGDPEVIDFTVAAGTAVEKGTAMTLTDPRTATANTTSGSLFAGVAATEKATDKGDVSVELGLWVNGGRFLVTASGAVLVGEPVVMAGAPGNMVTRATTEASGARVVGYALEAIANNTTGEIILRPGAGGIYNG